MSVLRRALTLLVVAATGLAVVAATDGPSASVPLAEAADTSQFRAGNIISDQLFYDGNAMSPADVQFFLESRNPRCVAAADGTPCLQDAWQDTYTRPADSRCPGTYVGAPAESAATIIAKVGAACGISQRVLLVILQKEQGLVTLSGNSLNPTRYEKAMGFGCPDTAPCNPAYAHLFNQIYSAARQYRDYLVKPRTIRAGIVNQVRFHPNTACGSSPVFVENAATAGLYTYTPYQPNAAALAAGKGTGDGCSAYGNRNFWIYYTDWFGSTQVPGAAEVTGRYAVAGGATGPLGTPLGNVACGLRNGGCFQAYANGSIYWSPASGARITHGTVRDRWAATGWETGPLGYPVSDTHCGLSRGGCLQHFQGGSIYWTQTTGARIVYGGVRDRWAAAGWEYSGLGYPVTDVQPLGGGGVFAHFEGGSVYWSAATGARIVYGVVRDRWAAAGWETGALGYPTTDVQSLPSGGLYAHFQRGSIYWSQASGARIVSGPLRDRWAAAGWEGSGLGYPVTDVQPLGGGGQFAHFQGGSVYWSAATGARIVYGVVRDRWAAAGWETGALGYPTTDVQSLPSGGLYAHFQRGSIYWTAGTGARVVLTPLRDRWAAAGWEGGSLGYPVADQAATPGGAGQVVAFQRGWVYWSAATGGRVLDAVLRDAWLAAGGDGGALGLPVGDAGVTPDGRARAAHFQGGSIYVHDSLGVRVLPRAVVAAWEATGWELGPLGYPTADAVPAAGGAGSVLAFQGGQVYQTASGAHALWGAVLTRYRAGGGADGVLGLPVTGVRSLPGGGLFAHFQHGSIYSTQATGARLVPIAVRDAWAATGWENGRLGYPTGDPQAVAGGTRQTFQGGTVTVSATGQATVQLD